MKRSKPLSALILIVLASLLSGAKGEIAKSKNPRANQHQSETIRHPDSTGNQEPQIPLAVWHRNQAALNESIATVRSKPKPAISRTARWPGTAMVSDRAVGWLRSVDWCA
jgi:hypothetical protein